MVEIKRADTIQLVPMPNETYKRFFIPLNDYEAEKKSRAAWARAIAKKLEEVWESPKGYCSGKITDCIKELLAQAEKDEEAGKK